MVHHIHDPKQRRLRVMRRRILPLALVALAIAACHDATEPAAVPLALRATVTVVSR